MNKEDFDRMIRLLQNPTRRKILEILSKEGHYPLQISKTLNTSQQAISKHLKTMEEEGIVVSKVGKSNRGGPPTKTYMVNSEFSLRIDIGPTLFKTEVDELDVEDVEGYEEIEKELEKEDGDGFLERQRCAIQRIDEEIDDLERKRQYLVKLKEKALSKGYDYIHENFDDYMERYVLYYILDSGETDPKKIAREFRVREDEIEELVNKLKEKTNIWC